MTLILTHKDCLAHDTGAGHPERRERLDILLELIAAEGLAVGAAPLAERAALERAHDPAYVAEVLSRIPRNGYAALDPDTIVSPGSGAAALRAAGAGVHAVDLIMAGTDCNGFAAVRPPGHHAEHARAMGFCLFNNVAIAARHALDHHKLARVAIFDFDVHHGNGTQDIFIDEPRVLFASTHQAPLYPGTGTAEDRGRATLINRPLPPGASSFLFREAWEEILALAEPFAPNFVFISAGFDAHRLDPLANLLLETEDYAWVTERILDYAARHADGRVLSTLEGGYDRDALRDGVRAHLRALLAASSAGR
ncbi:MAG TPA: histone deacetylase family protein [Dongiaceae bacterium]|jgi:acetoin utilization deacetylase AcuC-like enzyme|nr:histone deacetylase family protein [Dongiaceae bacterium]